MGHGWVVGGRRRNPESFSYETGMDGPKITRSGDGSVRRHASQPRMSQPTDSLLKNPWLRYS